MYAVAGPLMGTTRLAFAENSPLSLQRVTEKGLLQGLLSFLVIQGFMHVIELAASISKDNQSPTSWQGLVCSFCNLEVESHFERLTGARIPPLFRKQWRSPGYLQPISNTEHVTVASKSWAPPATSMIISQFSFGDKFRDVYPVVGVLCCRFCMCSARAHGPPRRQCARKCERQCHCMECLKVACRCAGRVVELVSQGTASVDLHYLPGSKCCRICGVFAGACRNGPYIDSRQSSQGLLMLSPLPFLQPAVLHRAAESCKVPISVLSLNLLSPCYVRRGLAARRLAEFWAWPSQGIW